jgi:hypothetical protein
VSEPWRRESVPFGKAIACLWREFRSGAFFRQ